MNTNKPNYKFPSQKKATALQYEIYSKPVRKFDWEGALGWGAFIAVMVVACMIIYFDNFILPTMGI